jgi:general secretion pathway protein G
MKKFSIFNFQFSNKYKGFTLIELLIVLAIIGTLTSLIMANFLAARVRGRDAQRKSDVQQMRAAFELYRSDVGSYPPSPLTCGAALSSGGTTYMQKLPCDPTGTGVYKYNYVPAGTPPTSYTIIACLENTKDSQKDVANNATYCTGGTTNWSMTITNP